MAKAKNRATGKQPPKKEPVLSLVERDGRVVRSFDLSKVTAKALRPILVAQIGRKSYLMTDEAGTYKEVGAISPGTAPLWLARFA